MYVCDICGKMFEGFPNNAEPVKKNGKCCDRCNYTYVIPARLRGMRN